MVQAPDYQRCPAFKERTIARPFRVIALPMAIVQLGRMATSILMPVQVVPRSIRTEMAVPPARLRTPPIAISLERPGDSPSDSYADT